MLRRRALLIAVPAIAVTMGATLATPASATGSASEATVRTAAENPWLDMRVMNMAHQGGENEAPSNTMYAFERAVGLGADLIELDVHATADDQLVVIHDATVDRTTGGAGSVPEMTVEELRALDAAYNFVPGRGTVPDLPPESYPFRGVRTGEVPPPAGYTPDDFAIPTLAEVLPAFPDTPVNIEIKGTSDLDIGSFLRTAELLAEFLNDVGRTDIIVVSFNDLAVSRFHSLAPDVPVAPGITGILGFVTLGLSPGPGVVALQIPVEYNGIKIATPSVVRRAHQRGYAVHVWMSGQQENDALYHELIDMCVDGIMPAFPARLEKVLDDRGIVRPGEPGVDPCA